MYTYDHRNGTAWIATSATRTAIATVRIAANRSRTARQYAIFRIVMDLYAVTSHNLNPNILMMKSTEDRQRDGAADLL